MFLKACCVIAVLLCICPVILAQDGLTEDVSAHDAEEKTNPFAGYPLDSICSVIAFFLLLLVLGKIVWKPMIAGLNARQSYIEKQIADAEDTKKDANQLLNDYRAKLDNVEHEGRRVIERHTKQAEKQSLELIEKAKGTIENLKIKAQGDIERQQSQAQAELWAQAGQIILELGTEVFGKSLDENDNKKLIDQAVQQLSKEEKKESELNPDNT
jgi:F-type H+-transporting ATPase subunit b